MKKNNERLKRYKEELDEKFEMTKKIIEEKKKLSNSNKNRKK